MPEYETDVFEVLMLVLGVITFLITIVGTIVEFLARKHD